MCQKSCPLEKTLFFPHGLYTECTHCFSVVENSSAPVHLKNCFLQTLNLPMLLRSELSSSIALFLARNDPEKLVAAPISPATDFTLHKSLQVHGL
jgi:hypothetical protein